MEDFLKSAIDIVTPVLESSMILAAHYTKACGRNTVTAQDVKYSMRFCARELVGKHIGTLFPELQDSDEDSECSDVEEVDEDEEPFTRYEGADPQLVAVNQAYDTWSEWVPTSPIEKLLKNAVDSQ
jgi:histone H3/H4